MSKKYQKAQKEIQIYLYIFFLSFLIGYICIFLDRYIKASNPQKHPFFTYSQELSLFFYFFLVLAFFIFICLILYFPKEKLRKLKEYSKHLLIFYEDVNIHKVLMLNLAFLNPTLYFLTSYV